MDAMAWFSTTGHTWILGLFWFGGKKMVALGRTCCHGDSFSYSWNNSIALSGKLNTLLDLLWRWTICPEEVFARLGRISRLLLGGFYSCLFGRTCGPFRSLWWWRRWFPWFFALWLLGHSPIIKIWYRWLNCIRINWFITFWQSMLRYMVTNVLMKFFGICRYTRIASSDATLVHECTDQTAQEGDY